MTRRSDKIDRWMELDAVEAAIPAMEATGTSEVARGVKPSKQTSVGFIQAYRFAEGDPETMADLPATKTSSWAERRRQFIVRHLAQMRSRDTHSDGFKPDGTPTKRMLGLIAWAYVPPESTRKAERWYKAGCPIAAKRRRNNGTVWYHCGSRPPGTLFDLDTRAGTGEGAVVNDLGAGGAGVYLTDNIEVARIYCQYADAPYLSAFTLEGRIRYGGGPDGKVMPKTPEARDRLLSEGFIGAGQRFDQPGLPHGPFTEIVVYVPEALVEVRSDAVIRDGRTYADLQAVYRQESRAGRPESPRQQDARSGIRELRGRTRRNNGRRESLLASQTLPVAPEIERVARRLGRERTGTLYRMATRPESDAVETLRRLGYVSVVSTIPAGALAPWAIHDVRITPKLTAAVAATQTARESYRDEFQQVGLFGSRNNPSAWDDPRRKGSEVQAVIFDAGRWTLGEARAWLRKHDFDGLDVDRKSHTLRFRQQMPRDYRRGSFRTISMGSDTGIQAVVALPR